MSKFVSRKFILALGCGVACTFLVYVEAISDTIFRDIVIATVGAYIVGNVYQKAKQQQ